jgi:hypothetical protein
VNSPETKQRILDLRAEGADLWVTRGARLSQSLWLMGLAIVLFIMVEWLGTAAIDMLTSRSPDQAQTVRALMNNSFLITPAVMFLASCALFVDSLRLRFKIERIDLEMCRLDPEARLLTSWPEEIGRGIRASLDKRRS